MHTKCTICKYMNSKLSTAGMTQHQNMHCPMDRMGIPQANAEGFARLVTQ